MRGNLKTLALELAARPEGFRPAEETEPSESLSSAAQRLVRAGLLFRLSLSSTNVRYFATEAARDAYAPDLASENLVRLQVLKLAAAPGGFWPATQAKSWRCAAIRLCKQGLLFRLQVAAKHVRYFTTEAARDAYTPAAVPPKTRASKRKANPTEGAAVPALRKALKDLRREKSRAARHTPQAAAGRPKDVTLGSICRVRPPLAAPEIVVPAHVNVVVLPSHPPRFQVRPPSYAPAVYGHRAVSR